MRLLTASIALPTCDSGGWGSDLQRDEAAFLVLDGAMVCTAGILLTVFHPGFCFSQLSNVSSRRAANRKPGDADILISPINDSLGDVRMATEDLRRRQKRHRLMKRIVNLASRLLSLLRQSHRRRHWSNRGLLETAAAPWSDCAAPLTYCVCMKSLLYEYAWVGRSRDPNVHVI